MILIHDYLHSLDAFSQSGFGGNRRCVVQAPFLAAKASQPIDTWPILKETLLDIIRSAQIVQYCPSIA
jgi:hypothetical protein